jgi:hypothetical protein
LRLWTGTYNKRLQKLSQGASVSNSNLSHDPGGSDQALGNITPISPKTRNERSPDPLQNSPRTSESARLNEDPADGSDMPKLADSHPYRTSWPSWMGPALENLESYTDSPTWRRVLEKWLELEDKLGYPYGQVCGCSCFSSRFGSQVLAV